MTARAEQLRAATLALLMVTSLFAIANVGAAAPGDPSTYAVTQGGECWEVTPLGDGTQNVSAFYDYRTPNTDPSGNLYGSYGTQDIQENQVSQLFVYNGSGGTSLVMLHDELQDGPNGSTITFDLSGLPDTREWVIEDDDYPNRDDNFSHGPTSSTIHWKWANDRTDGAAVRGLEDVSDSGAIQIDPGFNEDAANWNVWPYSGDSANRTDAWKLIQHPDDATSPNAKTELDMSQSLTVEPGTCGTDDQPPSAAVSAQPTTVEAGDQVSFDASASSDDGSIVEYRWDFDGNGTVDSTTNDSQVFHTYNQSGTYNATVTVVDDAGNTDNASVTITVTEPDEEPPNADLEVDPAEAEVGQDEVTFDASNSTDNGEIVEYQWDFGDGNNATTSEATVGHTYEQTGTFDATVTVVDAGGNSDTANATVNVSDTTPPVASADVPDQVVKNTTFEVDGSASTDNGEIASYEWDFGDNTTKSGETATHSYAANGTYTVTLTVTDGAGNTNSTSATVNVTDEDTQDPQAAIDAPAKAGVGEKVSFDGSDSHDDGQIESYEWDFDDGNNASGASASHSFSEAGTYTVSLTVTDGAGNTDTATHEVTVEEKSGDDLDAKFTVEDTSYDDKVSFDASSSTGDIVEYRWDLIGNDNTHRYNESFLHQYDKFGTYNVTLTVEDSDGNVDTKTKKVTVSDETEPTGSIDAPAKVEVGETFTAKATDLQDKSNITHVCWFVDGENVPGDYKPTLEWTFDEPGEHTLRMQVGDEHDNLNKNITKTITVVADSGNDGGGGSPGGSPGGNPGGDTDDDTDTEVDDSDDGVHVSVADATDDEPLTIDLPTGTETGDGLAAYDSITVTFANAGDYDMTVSALAEAPEDTSEPSVESTGFEPLSFLAVDGSEMSDADLSDAGFTFTIQQERLDALDADASDVQIYRYGDGSWSAVDTAVVEETDDAVQFRASDAGLSTFAVAIDRPVVELTDFSAARTEIAPGESVEITATLANDGQASGETSVELGVDGETVATEDVSVDANGERSITFERTFEEPGTYTVSANGQEVEVVVQAAETPTPTDEPPTETTPEDGQPGFGVVLAVLALLGAALLARRGR